MLTYVIDTARRNTNDRTLPSLEIHECIQKNSVVNSTMVRVRPISEGKRFGTYVYRDLSDWTAVVLRVTYVA